MKSNNLKVPTGIIILFVLSIVIIPACNNESDKDPNSQEINTEQLTTVEIKVEGMTCTECEKHITNAVMELNGINHAKLSHTAGNAVIEFDKSITSKEDIIAAIKDAGYKVAE